LKLLLLGIVCAANAFSISTPALSARAVASSPRPTVSMMAKKKVPSLEEQGFWAGEWVCADCGYIYEPDPAAPFEKLPNFWKCPQCAGPRRRFVKKAGNMLGKLDDSPLVIGTAIAGLIVVGLVYVGLTS